MPRLPHLDGLRALAILLVIAAHVLHFNFQLPGENLGGLGVLFFFILSGYLITGLLLAEPKPTLPTFYLRRALRLFPAFFLFLLAVAILQLTGVINDTSKRTLLDCLLYIRNLDGGGVTTGHIWSLSLEEQFYLLWPLVILSLTASRALRVPSWPSSPSPPSAPSPSPSNGGTTTPAPSTSGPGSASIPS